MYTFDFLLNKIQTKLSEEKLDFAPDEIYKPILYTLSLGGKRLRPVLALMACDLFGGNIEDAIYPAIGIEVFHNFTLLHDDIMDKAPIRRGKPSVYKKWDTNIAILSGDTMFALAYKYICKAKVDNLREILEIFNKSAIEVCEGQQFDLNYETQKDVSIADYTKMIMLKTAVLIGASLKTGASIAKAPKEEAEKIYDFGINLGIAFQLRDDILDIFGDESEFGKKTGGDIITNKKTFLYLKSFELAEGETLLSITKYFNDKSIDDTTKVKTVKEIYNKLKVRELAEEEITKYSQKAFYHLDNINIEDNKKLELRSLAEKLMVRKY